MFSIVSFLVSSSHETIVEENHWFGAGLSQNQAPALFLTRATIYRGERRATFFSQGPQFGSLTPFTTENPLWGTKLLGFSIGRGSGAALKGLRRPLRKSIWRKNKNAPG